MISAQVGWDIIRIRPGSPIDVQVALAPTAIYRAALARQMFTNSIPGDKLVFSPTLFDFGHGTGMGAVGTENVILPNYVNLVGTLFPYTPGQARLGTVFKTSVWSDQQGTGFVPRNNHVSGIWFVNDSFKPEEDGRTLGFDPIPSDPSPRLAIFENCRVGSAESPGNTWCFYDWNNEGHTAEFRNTDFYSSRICIAAMGSGSGSSQFITAKGCRFFANAMWNNMPGSGAYPIWGGVFGVLACGGVVRIIDCEAYITGRATIPSTPNGPAYTDRAVAITDTYYNEAHTQSQPSGQTQIEVQNLRSYINPNGTPPENCYDIDIRSPLVLPRTKIQGGWGIDSNNQLKAWELVPNPNAIVAV